MDVEHEDEYAPEPIRLQRELAEHLDSIETSVSKISIWSYKQVAEVVTAVKMLVVIGWIIAALVGSYVLRHW